jgi:hypothetical protein
LPIRAVENRRPAVLDCLPAFTPIVADTRVQGVEGVTMQRSSQLTWAIGLGYLLGRRRRLRTAVVVGAAAAASRFVRLRGSPPSDATRQRLAGGSVAKLGAAGRAAALTALGRPVDRLSQRLDEVAGTVRAGVSARAGDQ